jgi:hypothetical protein
MLQCQNGIRGRNLEKYKIAVYPRKGSDVKELCEKNGATYLEDAPLEDISSTEIREGERKTGNLIIPCNSIIFQLLFQTNQTGVLI